MKYGKEITEEICIEIISNSAKTDSNARKWLDKKGYIEVTEYKKDDDNVYRSRFVEYGKERFGIEYQEWRREVLISREFACEQCGTNKNLQIHHIESWALDDARRFDVDNAMVLCKKCHAEKHPKHANLILKSPLCTNKDA